MSLDDQIYPYAFFQNKVTIFRPSKNFSYTYFGGPSAVKVQGVDRFSKPLHHILTIYKYDVDVEHRFGSDIPLFYGLHFDSPTLQYEFTGRRSITLTGIDRSKAHDDWPYPDYPVYLPYIPLEIESRRDCTIEEFNSSTVQGVLPILNSELIVVIPSNPELRMSIWEPEVDKVGIQMIFRFDTETGITKAHNACA